METIPKMVALTPEEQAYKAGRIDAQLEAHEIHLAKINGSIDRFTLATEAMGERLRDGLAVVTGEIRGMKEEARLAEARAKAASETLVAETRRREDLAEKLRVERAAALEVPVRKWGLRANKAQIGVMGISFLMLVITVLTVLYGNGTL